MLSYVINSQKTFEKITVNFTDGTSVDCDVLIGKYIDHLYNVYCKVDDIGL